MIILQMFMISVDDRPYYSPHCYHSKFTHYGWSSPDGNIHNIIDKRRICHCPACIAHDKSWGVEHVCD